MKDENNQAATTPAFFFLIIVFLFFFTFFVKYSSTLDMLTCVYSCPLFLCLQTACIALCAVSCVTFGSWYLTSGLPSFVFLIWACILALTVSGSYLLFPLAVGRSFGLKHYLSNIAVAFTAVVCSHCLLFL